MRRRSLALPLCSAIGLLLLLSPSCAMAVCGDTVIDVGEQCDDGNTVNGDCCSSSCQYDASGAPCTDDGATARLTGATARGPACTPLVQTRPAPHPWSPEKAVSS